MLQIHLIDSQVHTDDIAINPLRGDNISRFLKAQGHAVIATPYLMSGKDLLEPISNLYLIHITQDYAAEYVQNLNKQRPATPVILFSGGGIHITQGVPFSSDTIVLNDDDELTIKLQEPQSIATWLPVVNSGEETAFLGALGRICELIEKYPPDQSGSYEFALEFHKIMGVDQRLGAKLGLLHFCLSSEGAGLLLKIFNSEESEVLPKQRHYLPIVREIVRNLNDLLEKPFKVLNPNIEHECQCKQRFSEWTIKDMLSAFAGISTDTDKHLTFKRPIDKEYLAALSSLRDTLLVNN